MKIGVDYYPEQWDRSMWNRDADLMARTGVKMVRIAELAWSKLEPQDGQFDFSWLDDIIGIFSHYGIEVVMCVPTNCPPRWMYEAHPEIIQAGMGESSVQSRSHSQCCLNSMVFMSYAKRITEQLIRRYIANPTIVAWQIDSELKAPSCCCEVCREKFREWLLERYDNLETINTVLGMSACGGEYSDISQIQPPDIHMEKEINPALCLNWYRFISESAANYVKELSLIIRREAPKAKITTNIQFDEDVPDLYKLFNALDFVSYDNYPPVRLSDNPDKFSSHAFYLDLMRGIKDRNFWVMEQLSGPVGSRSEMSPTTIPGMIKGYSLQALAHGADTVLHYRWRTAVNGAGMFRHGLIDHSNVPGRRFFEFTELCKTASKLNVIDTTELVSDVAILYSPENEYAFKIQPQTEGFSYIDQLKYFHKAFARYGANIDVVSPDSDLSAYKVVIAPSMYIYRKKAAENIYRYVINGGTLIMTTRSGVKDANNNCVMDVLPTSYKELIGAEIVEYDPVGNTKQTIIDFAGNTFTCRQWCDILRLTTAKAYAKYNDSFYRCCPAVTMNRYCSGVAYYVGTVCKMDFYEKLANNIMKQTGIPRLKGLPEGVEVTTRTNGLDDYIFFFNNSEKPAVVGLPKAMYSIIDSTGKEKIELKPFDMDIVRK